MTRAPESLPSLSGRVPAWHQALLRIATRPWLGYGPGTFRDVYPRSEGIAWHIFGSHNAILDAALYSGIFAGLFYACFLFGTVVAGVSMWRHHHHRQCTPGILAAFWVLLAMSAPFLMPVPPSSHLILLLLSARLASPSVPDPNPETAP